MASVSSRDENRREWRQLRTTKQRRERKWGRILGQGHRRMERHRRTEVYKDV